MSSEPESNLKPKPRGKSPNKATSGHPTHASRPADPRPTLDAVDAAALDAVLLERGLAEHAGVTDHVVPAEDVADPQRVARVRALLGLLDADAADASSAPAADLARRTLQHVAQRRATALTSLCSDDAAALETVLAHRAVGHDNLSQSTPTGFTGPALAGQRDRCENLASVLALLDRDTASDVDVPEDLAARTLHAVQQARQRERFAQQIDMLRHGPRTTGVSWKQVFSAAAVLLIGVSLLLPMMSKASHTGQQMACMSNMGLIGSAFNSYAADHAGVLPRGRSMPGSPWWNVGLPNAVTDDGTVFSNSAHLYTLVRAGYLEPGTLACKTNEFAPPDGQMTVSHLDFKTPLAVSYSYQNQFTLEPLRVDDAKPAFVVLADKNPLFIAKAGRIVFDDDTAPTTPSRLHGGRGQNALSIDGHAQWTITPATPAEIGQPDEQPDVFWSVLGKRDDYRYTGEELPAGIASDTFLVP